MRSPSAARQKTLKTLVAIAATLLIVSAGADVPLQEGAPRRSLKPLNWSQHVYDFGNTGFQQMYRMPIHRFYELLDGKPAEAGVKQFKGIRTYLTTKLTKNHYWRAYKGRTVPCEIRLAATLRWLAGGQWQDLRTAYGCSKAELFRTFWVVIDAINHELDNIHFPIDDLEGLQKLEANFRKNSRNQIWTGQVGALDGCVISTVSPGAEVDAPKLWYCARKCTYAILLQAIADADRRFLWYDLDSLPTSHDSSAFMKSELGQRIENHDLPEQFHLSGDNAYRNGPSLVTPGLGARYSDFNFEHSSNRMPIEQAFGELFARWGIFWRPLRMLHGRRALVTACCLRLHNWCVDNRIKLAYDEVNGMVQDTKGEWVLAVRFDRDGRPVDFLDTTGSQAPVLDTRANIKRDALIQKLHAAGLRRPYVSYVRRVAARVARASAAGQ